MNIPLSNIIPDKFKQELENKLSTLSELDNKVIRMRFGLDGKKPKSERKIATVLNVPVSSVKEIIAISVRKLRRPLHTFDGFIDITDICEIVNENIKLLNEKERTLLAMLYGYRAAEPKSIEQIANIFNESVEQINLDIETAKQKLKRGV